MIRLLLLLLFASSVNLQTITSPLPVNGQIRGTYYGINDTVHMASGDNELPQNLKDNFRFDEQKNLVVKTTTMQTLGFIIVYQNALDPIFEWCRSPDYKLCEEKLIVCFDQSCSGASMFYFEYLASYPRITHLNEEKITGECVHVHSNGFEIDQGAIVSSPAHINSQAFPQDVSFTQTFVHIHGSTCGAILRFPKASLAFTESLSSPSTTTAAAERLSNSSVESSNGTFSTTSASDESNTWQLIAIIGGSVFGVILILGLIALVVYLCLRKNTSKKPTSKIGMKIVKLRATKSMESVANVVPSSPPKVQPAPSKVTKPLPPTSKPTEAKVPETQPPKVLPIQPKLKTESTQTSGESVATAVEKREKCGVFFPREFSDDPTKTAEERTKEPSGDLSLIETAFPRMDIDSSKPYSKLFEADFKIDLKQELSAPRQPKLIIPLLTQRIEDKSVLESQYTADCLAQQAFRLPLVEDRAAMLLQATIKANNQLFDLGFRRKITRRDPDAAVGYYVTAPSKSEKWLKELKEGNFLQFIVDAAAKNLLEKWGEYGEDEILWRNYAYISDVPECLRQACSIGQSKKRRHFFTMAVYYQMANQMKKLADEESLGVLGYPVPLLLDLYREAPHYFAVVETASTEANDVTK